MLFLLRTFNLSECRCISISTFRGCGVWIMDIPYLDSSTALVQRLRCYFSSLALKASRFFEGAKEQGQICIFASDIEYAGKRDQESGKAACERRSSRPSFGAGDWFLLERPEASVFDGDARSRPRERKRYVIATVHFYTAG